MGIIRGAEACVRRDKIHEIMVACIYIYIYIYIYT